MKVLKQMLFNTYIWEFYFICQYVIQPSIHRVSHSNFLEVFETTVGEHNHRERIC